MLNNAIQPYAARGAARLMAGVGLHRILKLSLLPHPGQRIRASGFSTPTRNSLSHLLHVTPLVSARSFCRASRRFCSILQISRSIVFDVIVRLLFPCYCCWMGRGNAQPAFRADATTRRSNRRYALNFSASSSNRFPSLSFGSRIKLAITAAFNSSNSRTMSFTSSQ